MCGVSNVKFKYKFGELRDWRDAGDPNSANLIIHIGMEKTGSKAMQVWMNENRELLNGYRWKVPTRLGKLNHRKLAYLGFTDSQRDDGTERRRITSNDMMGNSSKE